jgi:hypothetical protein
MSNYYDNQTTMDNALRTICYLCEENSKLRADLEGWKRVHEDAMHTIATRNEEIAGLKKEISDLNYELEVLSQDNEGYDDKEDECPSVSARNPPQSSRMIDPPSGWKYGFPKQFNPDSSYDMTTTWGVNAWLLNNGYPFEEIKIWVPKDKRKAEMSFDYVLTNAEVHYRTWTAALSEDGS